MQEFLKNFLLILGSVLYLVSTLLWTTSDNNYRRQRGIKNTVLPPRVLFPCQYLCGTILVTTCSMVWDWRVSRAGPMPFYWPSCSLAFCFLFYTLSGITGSAFVWHSEVARSRQTQCSKSCDMQPAFQCAIRGARGVLPCVGWGVRPVNWIYRL